LSVEVPRGGKRDSHGTVVVYYAYLLGLKAFGNRGQEPVLHLVAEAVVYELEVVEV